MRDNLVKRILKRDARAAAQLLTLIENQEPGARAALRKLYRHTGKAHVIGVTGAAGTGKSALIARMTAELRRRERQVGVLSIDPTSPFSGGALLGDRIRMRDHFLDEGVFIRSLATRRGQGGVSSAVREAVHVLDAMGKEAILVETIGAGQDQVEVSTLSQTVVLVLIPWSGDEIQAMKAGLLEIADLVVVNKCDLPGADAAIRQLDALYRDSGRVLFQTSAMTSEGVALLVDEIERRRERLLASGDEGRKNLNSCRHELLSLLQEKMLRRALEQLDGPSAERLLQRIAERDVDPYTAAEKIVKSLKA